MTDPVMTVVATLISYVIGAIPSGLWLGQRFRGVDIREHGSRNIGATNTMRVLGKTLGVIALAADMGKGFIAVFAIARLSDWAYAPLACGMAAILGHTLSIFIKFRGGKGVATSAGVFLGLAPIPTLAATAAFLVVVGITRMVSAGSVTAAVALAIGIFVVPADPALRAIVVAVAILVIVRHRTNIQRILRGRENKI